MNQLPDTCDAVFIASQGEALTLLGATGPEWIVGIVVGIVVYVAFEILKVATRRMGGSLPYLLLRLAKYTMPRDQQYWHADVWLPELDHLLHREGTGRWSRYLRGVGYASGLALGGGRRTARAASEPRRASEPRPDGTSGPRPGRRIPRPYSAYLVLTLAPFVLLASFDHPVGFVVIFFTVPAAVFMLVPRRRRS
ncbi:hypothetical protein B4N89_44800 [Embleya scabrispora]|uniref:Uncharacterized protein n=1 Tax=Embleya scabrispora TaxID=159449 RepID=A0A1T3NIG0_9ACTN|nr:hypothetical protein [Embleya scabrispora]OPC76614.1 hypothetical protein B4N89_44800 [Embleya scabrispora]